MKNINITSKSLLLNENHTLNKKGASFVLEVITAVALKRASNLKTEKIESPDVMPETITTEVTLPIDESKDKKIFFEEEKINTDGKTKIPSDAEFAFEYLFAPPTEDEIKDVLDDMCHNKRGRK